MTQNSTQLQLLRGTEAQNDAYTGSPGELTVDTTNNLLRLHDGVTPGGHLIGSGSGGGGGTTTYTNATPVPTTLGGVAAGTTFTAMPLTEVFDLLLYPYQVPTFSAFSISGQNTTLEVGDSITAGTKTFTWTTTNPSNISTNSIFIYDWTNSTTVPIASSLTNDGTENVSIPLVTKTTATSHVYRISGSNTQDTGFSRDYTVNWRWKMYWGTSALTSLTESDIEALANNGLVSNSTGTFSFIAGGYKYIAYPTAFGLKTSFKDNSTGFDVDMQDAETTSVTNAYGITTNYYVHRTTNVLGGSITIIVA